MANEKRLLPESERVNLIRCLKKLHDVDFTPGVYEHSVVGRAAIFLEETAAAVEVVHGRWDGDNCTNCKLPWNYLMRANGDDWGYFDPMPPYCPNCGAKMDGDVKCE